MDVNLIYVKSEISSKISILLITDEESPNISDDVRNETDDNETAPISERSPLSNIHIFGTRIAVCTFGNKRKKKQRTDGKSPNEVIRDKSNAEP